MSAGTVQPDTVKIGTERPREPVDAVERCIEGALVGDLYRVAKKIRQIEDGEIVPLPRRRR